MRPLCLLLAIISTAVPRAGAQILSRVEAEDARITCAAGREAAPNLFATGGKTTPAFWGREPGDAVAWAINLKSDVAEPRLLVRYAYASEHYRNFSGAAEPQRKLRVIVDDHPPIDLPVPNTGWWELFEPADVALPRLGKGLHQIRIESPAAHAVTTIDSMILHVGPLEKTPVHLRTSTIARSENQRWAIRATPAAPMKLPAAKIFAEFDRIYDLYEKEMGWAPPTPVPINLIEQARWPNPGATAFQNNGGVWFRADVMHREQGNWCHEMTHMFYVAHFPWWFDESSVRALTTFRWVPTLYSTGRKPEQDPAYRAAVAAGKDVLAHPDRPVDNIDAIHFALFVKYGPDIFQKFFHACVNAADQKQLDFTPGRHLTRDEIVKYMSHAAGEDVTPLYQRWTGFATAE